MDRTGREGTGAAYVAQLVAMGVPEERLVLTQASFDPAPSRLVVTAPHWTDADYYASLLGVGKQPIDRLPAAAGRGVGIQLVLGDDVRARRSARCHSCRHFGLRADLSSGRSRLRGTIAALLAVSLLIALASCGRPVPPATANTSPPTVSLGADDVTGEATFTTTFRATASDPDGNLLNYAWSVNGAPHPNFSGRVATITFTEAGT